MRPTLVLLLPILLILRSSLSHKDGSDRCDEQASAEGGHHQACGAAAGWLRTTAGIRRLLSSPRPLVFRFDLPGCDDCPRLDPLWDLLWKHFEDRVWRVNCVHASAACRDVIGSGWDSGSLIDKPAPMVVAWSGGNFEPYDGERSADAVAQWAKALLTQESSVAATAAAAAEHLVPQQLQESPTADAAAAAALLLIPGQLQVWPGLALPTQVFLPAPTGAALTMKNERLPILVYLHGSPQTGVRGQQQPPLDEDEEPRSNYFARDGFLPRLLADNRTFASQFGFIALFPCSACDERDGKARRLYGGPPTSGKYGWQRDNFNRIDTIVAAAVRHLRGDPRRVMLAGVSYGGRGVWAYGAERPSMFAALVPVCASVGPTPEAVAALSCTHSAPASVPKLTRSRKHKQKRKRKRPSTSKKTRTAKNHTAKLAKLKPFYQQCHRASVWAVHGANDIRADVRNTDMFVTYLRNKRRQTLSRDEAEGGEVAYAAAREGGGVRVQYSRYESAPPLRGKWEGHMSDKLIFRDGDFWAWLADQECEGCTGWLREYTG